MKNKLTRRSFFKRAIASGIGGLFAMAIPKKVYANCFIPSFEEALAMVVKEVIDYFSGDFIEKFKNVMEKYLKFVGENTQESNENVIKAGSKMTDSINKVNQEAETARLERETKTAPQDCTARSLGEALNKLTIARKEAVTSMVTEYSKLINTPSPGAILNRKRRNKKRIEHVIDKGRIDFIDGGNFLTTSGYSTPKLANEVLESLMGDVPIIQTDSTNVEIAMAQSKSGVQYLGLKNSYNAKVLTVYEGLSHVVARRTPSASVQDFMFDNSDPAIGDLLSAKGFTAGLSLVDIENLELERTYFSASWRKEIREDHPAQTPLQEELTKLTAYGNYVALETERMKEMNTKLDSLKSMLLLEIQSLDA